MNRDTGATPERRDLPPPAVDTTMECMGRWRHKFNWMPDELLQRKQCGTCGEIRLFSRFEGQ